MLGFAFVCNEKRPFEREKRSFGMQNTVFHIVKSRVSRCEMPRFAVYNAALYGVKRACLACKMPHFVKYRVPRRGATLLF